MSQDNRIAMKAYLKPPLLYSEPINRIRGKTWKRRFM